VEGPFKRFVITVTLHAPTRKGQVAVGQQVEGIIIAGAL
jgi:hypothetical protein